MDDFDWNSFLHQWSVTVLQSASLAANVPPQVVASRWLGYPGATEAEIMQAEARLEVTLPLSYRAFLGVSNGWHSTGSFLHMLWPLEKVERFSKRHQPWIDVYVEGRKGLPPVTDEEYLVYGEDQAEGLFRPEYLQTALEISARESDGVFLLNPQIVTAKGEWEAWFFANWLSGAERYRSFLEMMQAEYEDILANLSEGGGGSE